MATMSRRRTPLLSMPRRSRMSRWQTLKRPATGLMKKEKNMRKRQWCNLRKKVKMVCPMLGQVKMTKCMRPTLLWISRGRAIRTPDVVSKKFKSSVASFVLKEKGAVIVNPWLRRRRLAADVEHATSWGTGQVILSARSLPMLDPRSMGPSLDQKDVARDQEERPTWCQRSRSSSRLETWMRITRLSAAW